MRVHPLLVLLGALLPACDDCNDEPDVVTCDADYTVPDAPALDAAAPDAAAPDAATPDAAAPDAALDAMPVCSGAGDTVDHLEPLGGTGIWPQLAIDGFGAAIATNDGAGGKLVLLGADGARRAPDLALPTQPYALAFDGVRHWYVERIAGPTVQVRSVDAAGTVSVPIVVGNGQPIYGALAAHTSGDVAVMWNAVDGTRRATVIPAVGPPVETVLDTPVSIVNAQLVGSIVALPGDSPRFLAAYARVDSFTYTSVTARPLAPVGAPIVLATGGTTVRDRVGIAPGAVADTAVVTWRADPTVHAAIVAGSGAVVLADTTVVTATAHITRVGGRGAPGGGFEVLVDDSNVASNRPLILHTFDAAGAAVGAPRRIATVCSGTNEENLPFGRNGPVRYATWDEAFGAGVAGAF